MKNNQFRMLVKTKQRNKIKQECLVNVNFERIVNSKRSVNLNKRRKKRRGNVSLGLQFETRHKVRNVIPSIYLRPINSSPHDIGFRNTCPGWCAYHASLYPLSF